MLEVLLRSDEFVAECDSGITEIEWNPVSFTLMFNIGESFETLHTRNTPLCESIRKKGKLNIVNSHILFWICSKVNP